MVRVRQFDICRVTGRSQGEAARLAIILQHATLSDLATRVVAPLLELGERYQAGHAMPTLTIEGKRYIMATHLLATVPIRNLEVIANVEELEATLKKAIDFLFLGI